MRRWLTSQEMPSTSRWLVGSSRTIRSCSSMRSLASAMRRLLAAGERGDDGVEPVLEAGEGQAAEEPGEHVADLRAARPLVVGEIADDLLADGLRRVQGVVLGEDAETQPAVVGDAAGVRLLQLGEHPDEGGLAVAVAAHDTDPVALGHPEGYAVEQGTGAVHLADLLDIDQIDGHFTPVPGVPAARTARRTRVVAARSAITCGDRSWGAAQGRSGAEDIRGGDFMTMARGTVRGLIPAVLAAVALAGCSSSTGAGDGRPGGPAVSSAPAKAAEAGAGKTRADEAGAEKTGTGATKVAEKGGQVGGAGSACELPVTFDIAAGWKPRGSRRIRTPSWPRRW